MNDLREQLIEKGVEAVKRETGNALTYDEARFYSRIVVDAVLSALPQPEPLSAREREAVLWAIEPYTLGGRIRSKSSDPDLHRSLCSARAKLESPQPGPVVTDEMVERAYVIYQQARNRPMGHRAAMRAALESALEAAALPQPTEEGTRDA